MNPAPRTIIVTGANGFIGRRLTEALLRHPAFADAVFTLNDLALEGASADERVRHVEGDFAEPQVRSTLLVDQPAAVFHLAAVPGGLAEADYDLSRRVNLDATLALMEALRRPANPPRLVMASSIAVFGPPLPALIDDDTAPNPLMTYGAHKRMIEIATEHFGARGWIDGIALRLPGIVARHGAVASLKSAFLNRLFTAFPAGEDIDLPVAVDGTCWLLSVEACVEALLNAAILPAAKLDRHRALTLPALRPTFAELVAALRARYPESTTVVRYTPDPAIEQQFGRQPPLLTPVADGLGFRHDGDVATLVKRALS